MRSLERIIVLLYCHDVRPSFPLFVRLGRAHIAIKCAL